MGVFVGLGLHRRMHESERAGSRIGTRSSTTPTTQTTRHRRDSGGVFRPVAHMDRAIGVGVASGTSMQGIGGHKAVAVGCGSRQTIAASTTVTGSPRRAYAKALSPQPVSPQSMPLEKPPDAPTHWFGFLRARSGALEASAHRRRRLRLSR